MSNKAAKKFVYLRQSLLLSDLPRMTYDTLGKLDKRAPEITEEVNAGKMVWHKYDCIGCHTIFGNGSYFALNCKDNREETKGLSEKIPYGPEGGES